MGGRNLLLCFDAFGTLFVPRRPIAEQYAIVARQCGLDGLSTEQVQASFKAAFSGELRAHPNYGRASNMGAEHWWTNVIQKTFQPLVGSIREVPKDLAPRLLHRFSSNEGYTLHPGVDTLLRSLKHHHHHHQHHHQQQHGSHRVVVGVITNSDDRVPNILSSLGLRVSPLRFGRPFNPAKVANQHEFDIDLHCMSYDVGYAKPDKRIFDAAEGLAVQLVAAHTSNTISSTARWLRIHVGDEYEKDVIGARAAGWHSALIGANENVLRISGQESILGLDELGGRSIEEAFPKNGPPSTILSESTQKLLEWLVKLSAAELDG
ncbi:hypothetical protein N657DRAFT_648303 [Parathielavia appendiculata]|uniref:Haloacid dehalogenase n=1 Tax=Parathielavia appendiculata TaxID=2587402 RepID=A0AAN6TVZ1_9PEZI|nr:hypothetical protein N657DRAFT_648303 [Parathielavia appendiculata]